MNMTKCIPNPNVGMLPPGIVCLIKSKKTMAPMCRAIERKVRWCHHVVLSETRGGSVAT